MVLCYLLLRGEVSGCRSRNPLAQWPLTAGGGGLLVARRGMEFAPPVIKCEWVSQYYLSGQGNYRLLTLDGWYDVALCFAAVPSSPQS